MSELTDAIAAHARTSPDAPALVWHDEVTTYGELFAGAEAHRAELAALHLPPADPVGIVAAKSPEAVALILGCLLADRPFLLPSPALPDEVLTRLLGQAGCRHVLGSARPAGTPDTTDAFTVPVGTTFMLTTSGSTGLPKVVPLERGAIDRFVAWAGEAFDLRPGSTVLNFAPLSFDLCLLDVWSTLAHGGRVVLVDPDRATNGAHLLELVVRYDVDVIQAVPMFYRLVHDAARDERPLSTMVTHALFTGDAMPQQLLGELPAMFPKARLYNVYGCTETNDSFVCEVREPADGASIGLPLPGVSALVIDDNGLPLTGVGTGELLVSTPFQTAGYLDRQRFADRFTAHPTGADNRRYFRTGDLVRREADGRVHLVGRRDHQVKIRGVAINTAEVEHVLLRHPSVIEAAVIAEPDPVAGRRLVAHVRRAAAGDGAAPVNSLTLREHCARRLPRAAVPSVLRIVDAPLPRTSTGKVDRIALTNSGKATAA
ncbi:amino acid adenylation domain-containing protein [Dactylosporangium sp. CA-052675]|uniref:amino acid adenylation domain-containing protein n=1 Tax=Dactylosporangium sp. CA-052675 TaxID=3239927 RepID=UPI003D90F43F